MSQYHDRRMFCPGCDLTVVTDRVTCPACGHLLVYPAATPGGLVQYRWTDPQTEAEAAARRREQTQ